MKLNSRISSELITWEDVGLKRKFVVITNPLKLLRNFGHIIKNLRISFKHLSVKHCTEVENYLVRFCSESLQRFVVMCNTSKIIFKDLQKPLKNVTDLKIMMGKHQNLDHIRFLDENNLPNVNNVYIWYYDELKDLSVSGKLHYKNIEHFEICAIRLGVYPFSFENLRHLTTDGNCIVNDALCEFIGRLNDLKTLKIKNTMFGFNLDPFRKILKLQNISSNIVELQFPYHPKISSNDVLLFLKQTRKLRKLSIPGSVPYITHYSDFLQEITSNLDTEWTHHARDLLHKEPGYHHSDKRCLFIERIIDRDF